MATFGTPASAATILADFENGGLGGWTLFGTAWTVGGPTGTSPNILPPEGLNFARSGAPNTPSEANSGTATSPAFTVSSDTLSWFAAGWSGPPSGYNGESYFQILDAGLNVKAQFAAPQSDAWTLVTTSLLVHGLALGSTFYFRAVDGDVVYNPLPSSGSYAWLAMDNLTLTNSPEPETGMALILGLTLLFINRLMNRRAEASLCKPSPLS